MWSASRPRVANVGAKHNAECTAAVFQEIFDDLRSNVQFWKSSTIPYMITRIQNKDEASLNFQLMGDELDPNQCTDLLSFDPLKLRLTSTLFSYTHIVRAESTNESFSCSPLEAWTCGSLRHLTAEYETKTNNSNKLRCSEP